MTRGTVPYFGMTLAGSHRSPVKNGIRPMLIKAGRASSRRNPRMQNIAIMDEIAQKNQRI
jgi:hypothetical protein